MMEMLRRAAGFGNRLALIDSLGVHRYSDLLSTSAGVATALLQSSRLPDLAGARVAFLVPPGLGYVASQWGVWRAGGMAVPLSNSHPLAELRYVIEDADASHVLFSEEFAEVMAELATLFPAARFLRWDDAARAAPGRSLPEIEEPRNAMMLYTSGTTGKPKGVVITHANLRAQVECLVKAWDWTPEDKTVHVLPLHHTHGIVNVLTCALWSGASLEMLPKFDAEAAWDRFKKGLTLFMAVPTIYSKLIQSWEAASPEERDKRSAACRRMRLMVSGSAALPVSIFEKWKRISGHDLLERYGMTEIGMALSNPLHGARRPGTVGLPLPGVEVRLVDDSGEIQVRGPAVFKEYWRREPATRESFAPGGWFRTGDVASVSSDGYFKILGRTSTDIIKTGGYKVSALEIEETLREHPAVSDCAVVGVPDVEWGEKVAVAIIAADPKAEMDPRKLAEWAKTRLAKYKVPSLWKTTPDLPRNAMGKVVKAEVRKLF